MSKYFKDTEFECKCGCGKNITPNYLITMLDYAREQAGFPFVLNSANRCVAHNATIKNASPTSSHLKGLAFDIHCDSSENRYKMIKALQQAGFQRILIYKTFVHVDDDKSKRYPIVELME